MYKIIIKNDFFIFNNYFIHYLHIFFRVRAHLRKLLTKMANNEGLSDVSLLTRNFHIWPDFHGNRSPLADPNMRGTIVGLSINNSEENLALIYLATLQALSVNILLLLLILLKLKS